jgi:hypothetical protein
MMLIDASMCESMSMSMSMSMNEIMNVERKTMGSSPIGRASVRPCGFKSQRQYETMKMN